jgi:non-heme chloroperoxidase
MIKHALFVRLEAKSGKENGDADRILPAEATSRRQAKMIKNARSVELKGGPHGVPWTHAEQINSERVKFLA